MLLLLVLPPAECFSRGLDEISVIAIRSTSMGLDESDTAVIDEERDFSHDYVKAC